MQSFEEYLHRYHLEALTVAIHAKVRYLTVYNATKGHPIPPEHAQKIRKTVFAMTGIAFEGWFVLSKPVEDVPTIPIRRMHKTR